MAIVLRQQIDFEVDVHHWVPPFDVGYHLDRAIHLRVFSTTTRVKNKRAAILFQGGLDYVDRLTVMMLIFNLLSYLILSIFYIHALLPSLSAFDIPYDHIVITPKS